MTQKSETVGILKAMRVKLANGWTQGVAARRADGEAVNSDDKKACAYCLMGALWSLNGIAKGLAVELALIQTLRGDGVAGSLPAYNDAVGRTQGEILALVDKTIERLESAVVSD